MNRQQPIIFAQQQVAAYARIYDEIKEMIYKQISGGYRALRVTKYPPKVLMSLMEEFQKDGYGVTINKPINASYIEMWITWSSHQHE